MQSIINDLVQQSSLNAMKNNGRKPKEMLLGPITKKKHYAAAADS